MEMLIDGNRRNQDQCYGMNQGGYSSMKFRSFCSPPLSNVQGVNHQTFQSRKCLLPFPSKPYTMKTPVSTEKLFSSTTSSSSLNGSQEPSKGIAKSRTITIPINLKNESIEEDFEYSELWAGPAYSNSPPPSSLPIPKFSLKPKSTVSLDIRKEALDINFQFVAKSAPASPTRERSPSPSGPFDFSDSGTVTRLSCDIFELSDSGTETSSSPSGPFDISLSATLTLRRILNLDDTDN